MPRPRTQINWDEFDKLCGLQCTLAEIASWFECSEDTIENACKREKKMRFSDYYKTKSSKGKIALRRYQMKQAEAGNVTMQIWLGKQLLGQTDQPRDNEDAIQPLQRLIEAMQNAARNSIQPEAGAGAGGCNSED